jgi:hypothetical protein
MKSDDDEKSPTIEELRGELQFYQKELFECEQKRSAEYEVKRIWMFIALGILCVCLYNTKFHVKWMPDLEDGIIKAEYSDWWGFKRQTFYPVWRKPTGDDFEFWCVRYPDRTFHVFVEYANEETGEAIYFFPPDKK